MTYNQELEKAIVEIKESRAKRACIQLPDGMKPLAKEIVDALKTQTNAEIIIWLGSNFGACDIPLSLESLGIDLLLSWGHSSFRKKEGWS